MTSSESYQDKQMCIQFEIMPVGLFSRKIYPEEAIEQPCRINHYPVIHKIKNENLQQVNFLTFRIISENSRIFKLFDLWNEYRSKPSCPTVKYLYKGYDPEPWTS